MKISKPGPMRPHRFFAARACIVIAFSFLAGCASGLVDDNDVAIDAGVDASENRDTSKESDAQSATCERDEHVVAGECTPCPAGTFNGAGDHPEDEETACEAILCFEDEHVVDNACVECGANTVNLAGDDASGPDTECDEDRCPSNQRVESQMCVPCDPGTTNDAGDDASGPDTTCDPIDHCADGTHTCAANEPCVFTGAGTFECIQQPFISTWTTDNEGTSNDDQISLPLTSSGTYDFTVDWGDGTTDRITTWNQAQTVHTYAQPGTYTVEIVGSIEGWHFAGGRDAPKIVDINQWGALRLGTTGEYFFGAKNLEITATDRIDLTGTTTLAFAFKDCESLTTIPGIETWDVSNVTTMQEMFYLATAFDQSLAQWDVSNVTNMSGMFAGAVTFNQELTQWDVSSVTDMDSMFMAARAFNQDISQWDVSNVTTMREMFRETDTFNQDISPWDVSNVTDMISMFNTAIAFNQDISPWDVSNVTLMRRMFLFAETFDQDISPWDVSNVTTMSTMFSSAQAFDQDLSQWNVSNVTDMRSMFRRVTLSTSNYDALLNGWLTQPIQSDVPFDGGNSKYSSAAEAARQALIDDHNWSILDGGPVQ